ncbi:glycosyltransferase family 90 protein, partial [Calocera cornea HHB12733]
MLGAGAVTCVLAFAMLFILLSPTHAEQPSYTDTYTPRSSSPLPKHTYLPNGLVQTNPKGRHPIYDLIENAQLDWQDKLDRQSRTLDQAVAEYGRRYQRPPPRGFDKWWEYVQKHNVSLPDEYDQILEDLGPYFAYTPRAVRALQNANVGSMGTFTIVSDPSAQSIRVESFNFGDNPGVINALSQRVKAQLELMRGYDADKTGGNGTGGVERDLIEATGPWQVTFRSDDGPGDFNDWEFNQILKDKVEDEDYVKWAEKPDMTYRGWASACPPNSYLRQTVYDANAGALDKTEKYFIADHRKAMNPCWQPQLTKVSGFLASYGQGPGPQERKKLVFSLSKTEGLHGDVLTVPNDLADPWFEGSEEIAWADKAEDRVVWRDWTTGVFHHPDMPWRTSHRVNMVSTLTAKSGDRPVLPARRSDQPVGTPHVMDAGELNPAMADVGYIIRPIQCDGGACEEMETMFDWRRPLTLQKLRKYKFLLDIDGNGWSTRFKPFLSANSVVMKATIFPEWYMDRIQPWVHYVPIRMDMGDVYDVLTFF